MKGIYLFFIRPRRIGKSLFLSVIETYNDTLNETVSSSFFQGTDIFREPTPEKHAYLILKFNFSAVAPPLQSAGRFFF
jgi:hypothetical protein